MNFSDVVDIAGKNHLCQIAEANESYISEKCKEFSLSIDLDDGTNLVCYPADVIAHCCFEHSVSYMDNNLGAFNNSIQKQIDKMKRFNEDAVEKLENKFDAETIMKSPCIAFVTSSDGEHFVFNLCPMDICEKLHK